MKSFVYKLIMKLELFRKIENYFIGIRKNQIELLKGLIFNNTISDSDWLRYKNVSPGKWAADYGLLYTIYRVLNGVKPKSILEFGLGQSSKIIHQYSNYYHVDAITYEHDSEWIRFFEEGKDGDYSINIKKVELENVLFNGIETLSYKNINEIFDKEKFDFILVDGPFGSPRYSRSQIVNVARTRLCDTFCIIIDDTDRPGELETAKEVEKVLESKGVDFCSHIYSSSKDHYLICSSNLKFLTSL